MASRRRPEGLTDQEKADIGLATQKANWLNDLSAEGPVPKFAYDRLLPGWIRVLDLAPGAGDDPIVCSLSAQPLQGPEPYEAVSYVWGDPRGDHSITCNWRVPIVLNQEIAFKLPLQVTGNFNVTDNLRRLLLHLRLEDEPRRLWIDQICINQDDQAEKGAQIRVMTRIYMAASRVVIFLGDAAAAASAGHDVGLLFSGIDLCATLFDLDPGERRVFFDWLFNGTPLSFPDGTPRVLAVQLSHDGPVIPADLDSLRQRFLALVPRIIVNGSEQRQGIVFEGLRHLYHFLENTAWFRRAWTFQESVVGREAIIVYGGWSRCWDVLCKACQFVASQTTRYGSDWKELSHRTVAESVARRGQFRQEFALIQALADRQRRGTPRRQRTVEGVESFDGLGFARRSRLKALLPELRLTQAKEPVDKVLALTGFAHDDARGIVFANGNDDLELLYLTVVKYWITTREDDLFSGLRDDAPKPLMWDQWPAPLVVDKPELSFLSHVGEPKHTSLPSWVPDWDSPLEATPLPTLGDFRAGTARVEPASIESHEKKPKARVQTNGDEERRALRKRLRGLVGMWQARWASRARTAFSRCASLVRARKARPKQQKDHRLLLKGIPVGTVLAVEPDMASLESHAKILNAFAGTYYYPTTAMTYLDVYKIIASPAHPDLATEPGRPQGSARFWDSKAAPRKVTTQPQPPAPSPPARHTAQDLGDALDPLIKLGVCTQPERLHLTGRGLFSLKGGLLGLGPKRTAVGDAVYVIAGLAVPLVLRRHKRGRYTVVGECFTFGIMHGEVLEGLPEDKVEDLVLI